MGLNERSGMRLSGLGGARFGRRSDTRFSSWELSGPGKHFMGAVDRLGGRRSSLNRFSFGLKFALNCNFKRRRFGRASAGEAKKRAKWARLRHSRRATWTSIPFEIATKIRALASLNSTFKLGSRVFFFKLSRTNF